MALLESDHEHLASARDYLAAARAELTALHTALREIPRPEFPGAESAAVRTALAALADVAHDLELTAAGTPPVAKSVSRWNRGTRP